MEFTPHQKLLYVEQSLKGSGCSSPKVPSSSWYTYKAAYWARSVATLAGQLIITVLLRTSLSQALAAAFLDILCEWSLTSLTKYSTAYLHFIVHARWSLFTQAAWIKLWITEWHYFKKARTKRPMKTCNLKTSPLNTRKVCRGGKDDKEWRCNNEEKRMKGGFNERGRGARDGKQRGKRVKMGWEAGQRQAIRGARTVEGWRAPGEGCGTRGEGRKGVVGQTEEWEEGLSGETGRLTQSHSCHPDL